jgi:hypothetical protein
VEFEMRKKRVGVLVFTQKIKERSTRKFSFFDSFVYCGLNSLLLELQNEYEIGYCDAENIDHWDFVLVPIHSHYDVVNLMAHLRGKERHKCKVVVGGTGLVNIRPFKHLIDVAVFGRAEGRIASILKHEPLPNVWYKEDDPDLKKRYEWGKVWFLLNNEFIREESVGCRKKCAFCFYSWSREFSSKGVSLNYTSAIEDRTNRNRGLKGYEDFFENLDWSKAYKVATTTSLDGVTEKTRQMIFKPMSRERLRNKILEAYQYEQEGRISVKIFLILGYPWETEEDAQLSELREDLEVVDKPNKEIRLIITFQVSHLVPMPHTPLQWEGVNMIDFRKVLNKKVGRTVYMGRNIEAWVHPYITTPVYALEELFLYRAFENDADLIYKILLNSKYQALKSWQKKEVLLKYLPSFAYSKLDIGTTMPTDYIKTIYNIEKPARKIRTQYENIVDWRDDGNRRQKETADTIC